MIRASPCTSIETSVPALRLSRSRTAFGMAICPFEETVVLVISTYHGRTDSLKMQRGCLAAAEPTQFEGFALTVPALRRSARIAPGACDNFGGSTVDSSPIVPTVATLF